MSAHSRYLPTYRKKELSTCCDFAARGESLAFVGIAGIGKSNIVKYLTQNHTEKQRYLGDSVHTVRFAVIDANIWDGTSLSMWQLLLAAIQQATFDLPQPTIDPKIIHLSEEDAARRHSQLYIDHVCQTLNHRLMIILDDFDEAFRRGPLHMLEQFNVYRSAGNRERLSYLIFTKRLPHVLGRAFNLDTRCKFYDLFRTNIFTIGPYRSEDARQMVRHLNHQAGGRLYGDELREIERLGGGHARLLKVVFDSWLKNPPPAQDRIVHFAASVDVQEECRRIFWGLHPQERAVSLRLARGQQTDDDADTISHLKKRGLLLDNGADHWFSPLWAEYLRQNPLD